MKRVAEETESVAANSSHQFKKQATEANGVQSQFGNGLFARETVSKYAAEYAESQPYKHAVVSNLIDDSLLRSVRSEIIENISFTPKETDIYKIHQSGDLANLDGLPASALEKLPSLHKLRDALYSQEFRRWISEVSGAGPVSGQKTDMAVNVYVPGCHLLCHDDVIGSRRVSYILYLTDPDKPWKAEWGGALRLYQTDVLRIESGYPFRLPRAGWAKTIPPAWNQLSFFAVQPGESFHDVEEVYKRAAGDDEDDGGRFRMAISGWFHVPQEGEEGFQLGLEESMAEKSSLKQLQGNAEQFDLPASRQSNVPLVKHADTRDVELTEADFDLLIKYMNPNYLTPDTGEELLDMFVQDSTLQLSDFLNVKFAKRLREWMEDRVADEREDPFHTTSRPPHKHRYRYLLPDSTKLRIQPRSNNNTNPFYLLLDDFLPSLAFRKWLSLITGLTLKDSYVLARRFRRGLDYQLAQGFDEEDPLLEYCLCITPTTGWGGEDETVEANGDSDGAAKQSANDNEDNMGGYELYMAGEDAHDSDDEVEIPAKLQSLTGAGDRRDTKRKKADPAVYKAAEDDEDDGILQSNPVSWNTLSIVLRDAGTLKFVKYVSKSAPGDRWDFSGSMKVDSTSDVEDEGDEGDEDDDDVVTVADESDEGDQGDEDVLTVADG